MHKKVSESRPGENFVQESARRAPAAGQPAGWVLFWCAVPLTHRAPIHKNEGWG